MSEALIVVDVQQDFCEGGSLAVRNAENALTFINLIIESAKYVGIPIIYTRDWHPEKTPHFDEWPVHCVAGTDGAQFHPELTLVDNGYFVLKGIEQDHGYSAFSRPSEVYKYGSDKLETWYNLDALLKDLGVKNLIVVGIATDYCVFTTTMDARTLGYRVEIPLEATAAVEPSDSPHYLSQLLHAGVRVFDGPSEVTLDKVERL